MSANLEMFDVIGGTAGLVRLHHLSRKSYLIINRLPYLGILPTSIDHFFPKTDMRPSSVSR